MNVVIANTSPLSYLVLIGAIEILHQLYGHIHVPAEVVAELTAPGSPVDVTNWIHSLPNWLEIETVSPEDADASLARLDPGERAAILLALRTQDVLLVIDDALGRQEATARSIQTIGTLGVLRLAAIRNLLDLPATLNRLGSTNFRMSQSLLDSLISEDRERKGRKR